MVYHWLTLRVWMASLILVAVLVQEGESIRFFSREEVWIAPSIEEKEPNGVHRHVDPLQSRVPFFALEQGPSLLRSFLRPIRVGLCKANQIDSVNILHKAIRQGQSVGHLKRGVSTIINGSRGGSQVKTKARPSKISAAEVASAKKKKSKHVNTLSSSTPFFSIESIGDMTLSDVGKVFEYAAKSTQSDFDQLQFASELEPRAKNALQAVDLASAESRGANVRMQKIVTPPGYMSRPGDIDTFNFCAVMRLLTEWRMVRQVPEGHASFAVSMKMGHRDVCKNLAKIEEAAHDYIDHQRDTHGAVELFSPTLRDLLQYEVDTNVHQCLPRLTEVSGAMGLLWVRRQLQFQLAFFENAINSKKFPTSSDAYQAAYTQVYQRYHGRTIALIFNKSLNSAPERQEVYKCMNPNRLREVTEVPRQVIAASLRPPENKDKGSAASKFGFVKLAGATPELQLIDPDSLTSEDVEQWIAREMEKDAYEHIQAFLGVTQPLLREIVGVIDEFNMNDPKKV
jgi:Glycolipid transfer protein (GLTP)